MGQSGDAAKIEKIEGYAKMVNEPKCKVIRNMPMPFFRSTPIGSFNAD